MITHRIAFFLPSLEGGGAEKQIVNLANSTAEQNFSVDLVVVNGKGPLLKQISKKVNLINFNKKHTLFSLFKLISYLKSQRPNCLLSAMSHANVIVLLAKLLIRNKTRILVSIHTHLSTCFHYYSGAKKFKQYMVLMLCRHLYKYANQIIAVSSNVADDAAKLLHLPRQSINVIYNPVINKKLFTLANEKATHEWCASDRQTPLFLSVGRLEQEKNFDILIKAFHVVSQQHPSRLLILGEGSLYTKLKKLIKNLGLKEKVELLGYKDNPYVYIKNCDLFVLSSKFEGLSSVLIEALALAPRIIATNCPGGNAEILEYGKYGVLVEVNNVESLAEKMLDELQSKPINRTQSAWKRFTFEQVYIQYLELFKDRSQINGEIL